MSSSYLGGSDGTLTGSGPGIAEDEVTSITVDASGNLVAAGYTYAGDFPITAGAYQTSNYGFDNQQPVGFVSKLTADCTQLLTSTFLGGISGDYVNGLVLDSSGNPLVAGFTASNDFPVTTGAYQTTLDDSGAGFVSDLSFPAVALEISPNPATGGVNTTGKLLLPNNAGTGGVKVTLSSDTSGFTVPASVTVPAAQSWTTFPITTTQVAVPTTVTITATVGS